MGNRKRPSVVIRVPKEHVAEVKALLERLDVVTDSPVSGDVVTDVPVVREDIPAVIGRIVTARLASDRPFFPQPKPGRR